MTRRNCGDLLDFAIGLIPESGSVDLGDLVDKTFESAEKRCITEWCNAAGKLSLRAQLSSHLRIRREAARKAALRSVVTRAAELGSGVRNPVGNTGGGSTTVIDIEDEKTTILQQFWVCSSDHVRKPLRDMDASDLRFAAAIHEGNAKSNLLKAAFLRQLEVKVGDGTVGDVMTEGQLATLLAEVGLGD